MFNYVKTSSFYSNRNWRSLWVSNFVIYKYQLDSWLWNACLQISIHQCPDLILGFGNKTQKFLQAYIPGDLVHVIHLSIGILLEQENSVFSSFLLYFFLSFLHFFLSLSFFLCYCFYIMFGQILDYFYSLFCLPV